METDQSKSAHYQLAIVVPVLNEADTIGNFIQNLKASAAGQCEILVVDGGSEDSTIDICRENGIQVICSRPGRSAQMNTGAAKTEARLLWFLHADCQPPVTAVSAILSAVQSGAVWGRFDVQLSGQAMIFRIIETMMNWRSCLTGVATGDQGLFMTRQAFQQVHGFPEIPLMEDIAVSKRLRRLGKPACLRDSMLVSSRRWERRGIIRTILLMWRLRLQYFLGVAPEKLYKAYYAKKN
jgi:rSAM/selenodomain-associated transferase 2